MPHPLHGLTAECPYGLPLSGLAPETPNDAPADDLVSEAPRDAVRLVDRFGVAEEPGELVEPQTLRRSAHPVVVVRVHLL